MNNIVKVIFYNVLVNVIVYIDFNDVVFDCYNDCVRVMKVVVLLNVLFFIFIDIFNNVVGGLFMNESKEFVMFLIFVLGFLCFGIILLI